MFDGVNSDWDWTNIGLKFVGQGDKIGLTFVGQGDKIGLTHKSGQKVSQMFDCVYSEIGLTLD